MEKDVTVVPVDNVILVNNTPLQFDYNPIEGHEQVHAIQWPQRCIASEHIYSLYHQQQIFHV